MGDGSHAMVRGYLVGGTLKKSKRGNPSHGIAVTEETTNINKNKTMPNWNVNRLTVDRITPAFKEWLEHEGGFSFERIDPTPPEMLEDDSYADGWFNWRVEQWGTKWDVEYPRAIADSLLAGEQAHFNTAWSPPIAAIETLSKMFPDIEFRLDYYEGGCWFAGYCEFNGGSYSDVQLEDDEIKDFARSVFDEDFDDDEE